MSGAKCPICGTLGGYPGLFRFECGKLGCQNFSTAAIGTGYSASGKFDIGTRMENNHAGKWWPYRIVDLDRQDGLDVIRLESEDYNNPVPVYREILRELVEGPNPVPWWRVRPAVVAVAAPQFSAAAVTAGPTFPRYAPNVGDRYSVIWDTKVRVVVAVHDAGDWKDQHGVHCKGPMKASAQWVEMDYEGHPKAAPAAPYWAGMHMFDDSNGNPSPYLRIP